jgi:glutathione S-transferase
MPHSIRKKNLCAEWLFIKFDIQKVDLRNPAPYFLKINPIGSVPLLQMNNGDYKNQVDAFNVWRRFSRIREGV